MSAPEWIWADEWKNTRGGRDGLGHWSADYIEQSYVSKALDHPPEQYTRTDLIPAMIQAAVDAEREACAMVAAHAISYDDILI